jgi:hypothetical protein
MSKYKQVSISLQPNQALAESVIVSLSQRAGQNEHPPVAGLIALSTNLFSSFAKRVCFITWDTRAARRYPNDLAIFDTSLNLSSKEMAAGQHYCAARIPRGLPCQNIQCLLRNEIDIFKRLTH